MKKKKCFIIISFIALLTIVIAIFLIISYGPPISYDKSILAENQDRFESAANICMDYHKESTDDNDVWLFSVDIDNNKLFCYNNNGHHCYSMTQEQKQIFSDVKSVFILDHHGLEYLYVNDYFVSFGINNGRCSFIYSPYNKKPDFVNSPEFDESNIYVEKIMDNWFYACK